MKTLYFLKANVLIVIFVGLYFQVSSQEGVVKTYGDKPVGKNVTLIKETVNSASNVLSRSFEIKVDKSATYFISILWHGLPGEKCDVVVDNWQVPSGLLVKNNDDWEISMVNDVSGLVSQAISLISGTHTICFVNKNSKMPNICEIQIGESEDEARLKENESLKYVNALKNAALPPNYNQKKKDGTLDQQAVLAYMPPPRNNPKNDDTGFVNYPYSYTYRIDYIWCNQGTHEIWETRKANPYGSDPVMYFFSTDNPVQYSWYNDDYSGHGWQSRIDAPISVTGVYALMIRAYNSSNPGTSDSLMHNGALYDINITLAGNAVSFVKDNNTGLLNYFTANPEYSWSKDTYLFVAREYNSPIIAFNDDYRTSLSHEYDWGRLSRVKVVNSASDHMHWALLCAFSPYQNGTVDFYANCEFANLDTNTYSLKWDDGIKSGEADGQYNCFSWSGGRTDLGGSFDPGNQYDPNNLWYDSRGYKQCFDNFYGNKKQSGDTCLRFSGAMFYIPTTNSYESVVNLYERNGYSHASVKKPGDNFLHGYEWESKLKTDIRIFHPISALHGLYGGLAAYYKPTGTMAKSSAVNGNKQADPISLSTSDMIKIDDLSSMVDNKIKVAFDSLYAIWKKTWSSPDLRMQSSPKMFFRSEEYASFAAFCVSTGKEIIPLLIKKYLDGDDLAAHAIGEIKIIPGNSDIVQAVRNSSPHGTISSDGYFILEPSRNGWIRYFKKLLDKVL
jgi:hypothetical protein